MDRIFGSLVLLTVLWMALMTIGYVSSFGAPTCEGPLILWVNESSPPSCNTPWQGFKTVGVRLYVVGLLVTVLVLVARHRLRAAIDRRLGQYEVSS